MYIREFDATIISSQDNHVILDRTAFYPQGGGLVSDTGIMNGIKVIDVVKDGENIIHFLSDVSRFNVGESVHCMLDWERRYSIMKMHTAAHLLSSVIHKKSGALITGNRIAPDESRIDFNLELYDKQSIITYIDEVNEIIRAGLDVTISFMKRGEVSTIPGLIKLANATPPNEEVLRIVKIGDVDMQADGGVHVRNTREIGKVILTKFENKGKANKRIYYKLE